MLRTSAGTIERVFQLVMSYSPLGRGPSAWFALGRSQQANPKAAVALR
jgi:hypothetical protein